MKTGYARVSRKDQNFTVNDVAISRDLTVGLP